MDAKLPTSKTEDPKATGRKSVPTRVVDFALLLRIRLAADAGDRKQTPSKHAPPVASAGYGDADLGSLPPEPDTFHALEVRILGP